MLSIQFNGLRSSIAPSTSPYHARVESQQPVQESGDTFVPRIKKSTPKLTFGMSPERYIELRPVGERKLTLVSELNPLGYLPIADIGNPEQMETDLRNKGLNTLRIKASDCGAPGDILVAFHEESLRDLIKGPFKSTFFQDIQNNGPSYFIKRVARSGAHNFERYSKIFSDFINMSTNERLAFLKNVGPNKPLGELNVPAIKAALGEHGVQNITSELEARGMKTLLRRSTVAGISENGALFAYDEAALKKLLDVPKNQETLRQDYWPTTPEGFVRAVSSRRPVKPGTALWRLIGKAFADPINANLYL
jgi:hypothetical protein